MNLSHSHIEVDFLAWTHFSNYILFICLIILLILITLTFYNVIKLKNTIRKISKYNTIFDQFHATMALFKKRKLSIIFPIILKNPFSESNEGTENINAQKLLQIFEIKIKIANNYAFAIFIILSILFAVPLLDLLVQYLMCYGTNTDMGYLASASIKLFVLSKYTILRVILFSLDTILLGALLFIFKNCIYHFVRYTILLDPTIWTKDLVKK